MDELLGLLKQEVSIINKIVELNHNASNNKNYNIKDNKSIEKCNLDRNNEFVSNNKFMSDNIDIENDFDLNNKGNNLIKKRTISINNDKQNICNYGNNNNKNNNKVTASGS